MIKVLIRWFIKITGFVPYIFALRPRFYYESHKAKKDHKKKRGQGAVIISNHTGTFDYYVMIYRYFFHCVHTLVNEIVYRKAFMKTFVPAMGNIKVKISDHGISAINQAEKYLEKKKYVLIFPEGHFENEKGKMIEIKSSAIYLAYKNHVPIIPYYTDGKYFNRRAHFICGEKIDLHKIINKETLSPEDIEFLKQYIMKKFSSLQHQLKMILKHKTQEKLSKKYIVNDLAKLVSPPWCLFAFWTRTKYFGEKKEIKKVLKDGCIIASNHYGVFDPICMTLKFARRRIRIVAIEELWTRKGMKFIMQHSGAIKFRRNVDNKIDMKFILECNELLEARACIGIYPQGEIVKEGEFDKPLKGGLALLSLFNKAPIIPMITKNRYKPFRVTKIGIGDVIYPTQFFDYTKTIDNKVVSEYNDYVFEKMKDIFNRLNSKV